MKKGNLLELQDKFSYLPIFARLLKSPSDVLSTTSDYKLTPDDFAERFHKILFIVINELFIDGVSKITKVEINSYLENFIDYDRIFKNNSGNEYVDRALGLEEISNFDFHYSRVKKFSLLRRYVEDGFDISALYDTELVEVSEIERRTELFNKLTLDEIIGHFDSKQIDIKDDYVVSKEGGGGHFSDGIEDLIASKALAPSYGSNFMSGLLNTVCRGARSKKLYCISGDTGSGKTRSMIGHILFMCATELYVNGEWIKTNNKDRGLVITTELEKDEITIPAVCFLADVEEDKVQDNTLTDEERERITYAMKVLKKTPIWFEEMFDFDDDDLEQVVEKYVNKHRVTKIGHDYLHSTIKMFESLSKKGARGLQEHQVLRISSIRLKNICNKYGVWILTGTQLNSLWKQGVLDQSTIEGSRSVANKFDLGAIQLPLDVRPDDQALWDEIKKNVDFGFIKLEPTHTISIYKNRGNRFKMVRVWVHFNLGTLRMTDLFVTNYKGEILPNISPTFIEEYLDNEEEDDMQKESPYDTPEEEIEAILTESASSEHAKLDNLAEIDEWFKE